MSSAVSSRTLRAARPRRGAHYRRPSPPVAELLEELRSLPPSAERELVRPALEIDAEASRDPEFLAALPTVACEAVELLATVIERGDAWVPYLPPAIGRQIRYLARREVPLDAAIRGYCSLLILLFGLLAQRDLSDDALTHLLAVQDRHADRILCAFVREHRSAREWLRRSPSRRLGNLVDRLLAGEPLDTAGLDYPLEGWHLGLIALGPRPQPLLAALAGRAGCRLLALPRGIETTWLWLGAEDRATLSEPQSLLPSRPAEGLALALGEPREGIEGWRLTHREAKAALALLYRAPQRLARCAEVLLPAALLRDPQLHGFLLDAYLRPLGRYPDPAALCHTLRAYFAQGCNAASAAALLGLDRHTVQRRLRRAEQLLGRRLESCRAELEVALRLKEIDTAQRGPAPGAPPTPAPTR